MLPCLAELEADLNDRRTRTEAEGWTCEREGIDLTLAFLRAARDEIQRPPVNLGLPIPPPHRPRRTDDVHVIQLSPAVHCLVRHGP